MRIQVESERARAYLRWCFTVRKWSEIPDMTTYGALREAMLLAVREFHPGIKVSYQTDVSTDLLVFEVGSLSEAEWVRKIGEHPLDQDEYIARELAALEKEKDA